MWQRRMIIGLMSVILVIGFGHTAKGAPAMIDEGKKVKFDYTLTVDGTVVDTSEGKTPLEYVQGKSMIIPGLERQLAGLKVGDKKTITVSPDEGYGEIRKDAFREVPKEQLPKDFTPTVGKVITLRNKDGRAFPATIAAVGDKTVTLNLNHPLAGKELKFDVKIVSVE